MNIQQMRYFAEVGRFQNITKAAEQLHIAQPTLSIAMHALEEETNLNLFRRVGRNIVLTKDGEHLLEKVNRLLMSIDRFDDEVKEMSHQRNYIRIGMPSQIAVPVMPLLLGRFREQHPDIDLEIIEESGMRVVEMVRREEVDLTIFHCCQCQTSAGRSGNRHPRRSCASTACPVAAGLCHDALFNEENRCTPH